MSTGAQSGRSEVTGVDGAAIDIEGTIDIGNWRDDAEFEIVCDSGVSGLAFLRRYDVDDAGTVTVINTLLDGVTPYVPVGSAADCGAFYAFTDDSLILCDTGAGGVRFLRTYRHSLSGATGVLDTFLDGVTPYVVVGPVATCIEVNVTASDCDDVEFLDLIDCTQTAFLRRIDHACDGTVTVVDTELDGTTPYVACDPVRFASEGALQSGAGGPAIVTRVVQAANYTTSSATRRVTIIWTGNAASVGNRVQLQIDAGAFVALVNEAGLIVFGDLASPDEMGYTITIDVNQNADDVTVIEEF
jgi:hypothetical protein